MQKTPEEERRIVRQNALGHAVEVVKILAKDSDSSALSPRGVLTDVIGLAEGFEEWVMRTDQPKNATGPVVVTKNAEPTRACPKCGEPIPVGYAKHFRCGWQKVESAAP